MTTKQRHLAALATAAKSGSLVLLLMLGGCLSDGSELIPPEPGGTRTTQLVAGTGAQPIYSWTVGPIAFLDVVRTSNPSAPVWGFNVAGGADVVSSPYRHGDTIPAGATAIGGSEPILTAGVQYRVRIVRNSTTQQFVALFTPPNGSQATLAQAAASGLSLPADGDNPAWATAVAGTTVGDGAYKAVAAGDTHSLAIATDGGVYAWGANGSGQLGDGTTADSAAPVRVAGLAHASAVAAGARHSLALTEDGSVWAWGENSSGQLGDGTTVNRSTPVRVEFLGPIVAIAAGKLHSLALAADGTVWSWGDNHRGQLGDGTAASDAAPAALTPPR